MCSKLLGVELLVGKKLARILYAIHSRRLDFDLLKPSGKEFIPVVALIQCPGYAANPQQHALANFGIDLSASHHI